MTVSEKKIVAANTVAAIPKGADKTAPKAVVRTKKAVIASKAAVKPVAKTVAKAAPTKPTKVKKPKMVRDSFTFPKAEYEVLDALKLRAAKLGKPVKKTELLRAGIKAIAAMSDSALLAALQAVPSLKTGRPAKSAKASS